MLDIVPLVLGFAATNCYLIAETESGEAVVIDPAWEGQTILSTAKKRGWRIGQFWYTHAHFDHFGGAAELAEGLQVSAVPGEKLQSGWLSMLWKRICGKTRAVHRCLECTSSQDRRQQSCYPTTRSCAWEILNSGYCTLPVIRPVMSPITVRNLRYFSAAT